jgi:hypothetical protein
MRFQVSLPNAVPLDELVGWTSRTHRSWQARLPRGTDAVSSSVVNWLKTLDLGLHGLDRLGEVPLPICDFVRDTQRLPGAV